MSKKLKPYTHAELWKFYQEGETVDTPIFAEMKSNIRLVNGDHYSRLRMNVARQIQDFEDLSDHQKIRITKNHIQKICRDYEDTVLAVAPGVGFEAAVTSEVQDQKAAELHHAVWKAGEEKYNFAEAEEGFVEDLVEIGEEIAKVFFDEHAGDIAGYYSQVDDDGQDTGEPDQERPYFKGAIVIEAWEGYNTIRPVECKDMKKAEWIGHKMMVATELLKQQFPDAQKAIQPSSDQTYNVFDPASGSWRRTEKETFVVEMYFRPSPRYPRGQWVYMTREDFLASGDLPGSLFPVVFQPCERIKGSPRGRSPIKTMRPLQIEINRCASKIAEHHATVGDDKIILLNGAKAVGGLAMPGVRTVNISGQAPTVMAGRDGSQYLATAESTVSELYAMMGVPEDTTEQKGGATDPVAMLFRSGKQKRVHSRRIRRHSTFKKNLVKLYLKTAKIFLSDDEVIKAIGSNEAVNISEFKNSHDMGYEVKVSDQSDDVETKLGQHLMYTSILQYVGNQLTPDQIGMMVREMPYANGELATQDLTLNFDLAENAILALDRGQRPPVHQYDDHQYMMKRLTSRVRQPSFDLLDPQVQFNYHQCIDVHEQFLAYNAQQVMIAEKGMIPTTGYLVVCDLYVPKPGNPTATERVKIPSDALQDLIHKLQIQGTLVDRIQELPEGAAGEIADKVSAGHGGPSQPLAPGQQFPSPRRASA